MEIRNRILEILNHYEIKQNEFAEKIGMTPQSLNNYLRKKSNNPGNIIMGIVHHFPEINLEWLLKGDGEMIQKNVFTTEEPATPYLTKQDLYNIHALVQKVHELDAIVRKLEKLLTR